MPSNQFSQMPTADPRRGVTGLRGCCVTRPLSHLLGVVACRRGKWIIPAKVALCETTTTLAGMTSAEMLPVQLTDAMWAVLEPLLPVRDPRRGGRPRVYRDRLVLDAIFYVLRSGCQWRMIPHDLVPCGRPTAGIALGGDGIWDAVHDRLRDQARRAAGRDPAPSAAVLDAQSIKSSEGGQARGIDTGKKITAASGT